jgi:hypothetical protein
MNPTPTNKDSGSGEELDGILRAVSNYYNQIYNAVLPNEDTMTPKQARARLQALMSQERINELENIPTDVDSWTDVNTNMSMDDWIDKRIAALTQQLNDVTEGTKHE